MTLTGALIDAVLEQQFPSAARDSTLLLSTSDGSGCRYDPARAEGDRVFDCSPTIGGVPVDPAGTYRVAATSFLVGGGDGFSASTSGTAPVTGPVDVGTAVAHLATNSLPAPPAGDHAVPVAAPAC